MIILVSFVFSRAVATKVAASCPGTGMGGSHFRDPYRTVFGGT